MKEIYYRGIMRQRRARSVDLVENQWKTKLLQPVLMKKEVRKSDQKSDQESFRLIGWQAVTLRRKHDPVILDMYFASNRRYHRRDIISGRPFAMSKKRLAIEQTIVARLYDEDPSFSKPISLPYLAVKLLLLPEDLRLET